MNFKDQMAADMAVFMNTDEFADTVVYNGVEIPAVFDYGSMPDRDSRGGSIADTGTLFVSKEYVIQPVYRDEVIAEGRSWRVSNVIAGDSVMWEVALVADSAPVI